MLVVVCLLSAVLFLPYDFNVFQKSLSSAATFTSNHYFSSFGSYFAPRVDELPLLHTWSLAIEMQFYLFFPVLVICVPTRWRCCVFASLAVGFFMLSGYQALAATPDKLYFSLIARIPEFMLGAVVALLIRQRELPMALATALGALGASMLVVSLVTIDKRYFPGFWSAVPCVGAALLIAARRGPVNAALATRPMVWFGGCPTRSISGIGRSWRFCAITPGTTHSPPSGWLHMGPARWCWRGFLTVSWRHRQETLPVCGAKRRRGLQRLLWSAWRCGAGNGLTRLWLRLYPLR